jgi:hypothetical protein
MSKEADEAARKAAKLLLCETGCFGRGHCHGCLYRPSVAQALREAVAAEQARCLTAIEATRATVYGDVDADWMRNHITACITEAGEERSDGK